MSILVHFKQAFRAIPTGERALSGYLLGLGAVALTSGIVWIVGPTLSVADASMLHLLPILVVAVRYGILPSIVTSVAAAVSSNFLFAQPHFGFGFQDVHDVITLAVFLIAAATVNYWAGKAQRHATVLSEQADAARNRQIEADLLYRIGTRISGLSDVEEMARAIGTELQSPVTIGLLEGDVNGLSVVNRANVHGLPLVIDGAAIGWIEIVPEIAWSDGLRQSIASEVSQALARARRFTEREHARVVAETAKLQSALVSSISHDFRTPLTTIVGAASSLQDRTVHFSPETRYDLLRTIQEAGERLHRYVVNLLNTGRLDAGAIRLNCDWLDVGDLLSTALLHVSPVSERARIRLALPPGLPMLQIDHVLIEQVILNLFDNALKYSPAESPVSVRAHVENGDLILQLGNRISGPSPDLDHIFDRFYRPPDKFGHEGSGLGLSICKGFVEAHGGAIGAQFCDDTITVSIRFPIAANAPVLSAEMTDD